MRSIALLCALCALAGALTATLTTRASAAETTEMTGVVGQIGQYEHVTWHWQKVMGVPRTPSSFSPERSTDPAYQRWVSDLWRQRALRLERQASLWMAARIRAYRQTVAHWRRVIGTAPVRETAAVGGREATFVRWRRLARATLQRAENPPLESAWRCIHRYEGSWRDANGPYYGGLQMDLGFQRRYGRYLLATKGTADHWTPFEQMWVAARAHSSGRGFAPWPNTARYCGVL
jgi:hypothetical protein